MDTHTALQIFHALFLADDQGRHPDPLTMVTVDDVRSGRWRVNPAVCRGLGLDVGYAREHLLNYVEQLRRDDKYDLIGWPYHAMLGGIGHALVPAVEEAETLSGSSRPRPRVRPRPEGPGARPR